MYKKQECSSFYYNECGNLIGEFNTHKNGVKGKVFAVDDSTIYIHDFHYDGLGPASYFWAGTSDEPSSDGFLVPYPDMIRMKEIPILKAFNGGNLILQLPGGKKIADIKWLAVWCVKFEVSLAEVYIPNDFEAPQPRILPEFKRLAYDLCSGDITILDSKTFHISKLNYNGKGPDAHFLVGKGMEPSKKGIIVPDENGSLQKLRAYHDQDIVIRLPDKVDVYNIDWLAVYSIQYSHNFGHVLIPKDLNVPPARGTLKTSNQ